MRESAYITRMKNTLKTISTRDEREIAHFAETSAQWWDEHGGNAHKGTFGLGKRVRANAKTNQMRRKCSTENGATVTKIQNAPH